jgi:UDP-glucose 4-epimerase
MTKAVLITGGAGFIGSHLVRDVLADSRFDDYTVAVIDDLSGGRFANLPVDNRLTFYSFDISDSQAHKDLDLVFRKHDVRYILHFAAYAAEGLSHQIRRFNYQNNVIGSANLINAAINHNVKRFVFASSAAVYGDRDNVCGEGSKCEPIDPYGVAKLAVEMDLRCAAKSHGLASTIFRMHNVYGERQNLSDKYRNVVGIFMRAAIEGLSMPIFGDGSQVRQFTYVGDIVGPIIDSVFRDDTAGQVINIGSDDWHSVAGLAKQVSGVAGVEHRVTHLPPRDEAHGVTLSHERYRRLFPDQPTTPLFDGLWKMWEWARTLSELPEPERFGAIEVERGLPDSWR